MTHKFTLENPPTVSLNLAPEMSRFLGIQDWLEPLDTDIEQIMLFTPRKNIKSCIEVTTDENCAKRLILTLTNEYGCKITYTEYSDRQGVTYSKVRIGN